MSTAADLALAGAVLGAADLATLYLVVRLRERVVRLEERLRYLLSEYRANEYET